MNHLTLDLPKPMIAVAGKNLIERKLEALPPEVDEVVVVVGYQGEKIRNYFGDEYGGRKIKYVEQGELLGTMSALIVARPFISDDRFLVMMGDDLYSREDIEAMLKNGWALLAEKVTIDKKGAKILKNENGTIADILERSDLKLGDLNNAGLYLLGKEIFNYPLVPIGNGEFGLPQTLAKASKDFGVKIVVAKNWRQLTSPEDVKKVEKEFNQMPKV